MVVSFTVFIVERAPAKQSATVLVLYTIIIAGAVNIVFSPVSGMIRLMSLTVTDLPVLSVSVTGNFGVTAAGVALVVAGVPLAATGELARVAVGCEVAAALDGSRPANCPASVYQRRASIAEPPAAGVNVTLVPESSVGNGAPGDKAMFAGPMLLPKITNHEPRAMSA